MLSSLGFPQVGKHRRFVAAMGIDALGSGVWMPISVLYFVAVGDLSLARIGAALTAAGLLAIPFAVVVGQLVDRFGAKAVVQLGNMLSLLGFLAYPFVDSVPLIALAAFAVALGRNTFFGGFAPMVVAVSGSGEREQWFGFLGALRNAGFGLGGLVAAVALSFDSEALFHAIVLANAFSYLLSAVLLSGVGSEREGGPGSADAGSWRAPLTDSGYWWLIGCSVGYAMGCLTLNIAVPVYLVERLGLPGWLTGTFYVINTVLIGLTQGLVVKRMGGRVRSRLIRVSGAAMVCSFALLLLVEWLPRQAQWGVALACAVVILAAGVYTVGEMIGGPVLQALAAEAPPAESRGRYLAVYQLSWNLSAAIAPVLFLWLLDHGGGLVWWVVSAIVMAGALCSSRLRSRMPLAATRVLKQEVAPEPTSA